MKRSAPPIAILTGFFLLSSAVIITQFLSRPSKLTQSSSATERNAEVTSNTYSAALCPLNTSIYVDEITQDGSEVPFDFSQHKDTDVKEWGFADEIHLLTDPKSRIPFNQDSKALYKSTSGELSFINVAGPEDVYPEEKQTYLQLIYDKNAYEIMRKEVKECSRHGSDEWLCLGETTPGTQGDELDTHYGIKLKCNMDLSVGWVIKAKNKPTTDLATSKPVIGLECDINLDNVCNSIDLFDVIEAYGTTGQYSPADINRDFRVDARDYSVVMAYLTESKN